jgi:hypothetical protein
MMVRAGLAEPWVGMTQPSAMNRLGMLSHWLCSMRATARPRWSVVSGSSVTA